MAWVEVGLPAGLRAASGGEVVRDRVRTHLTGCSSRHAGLKPEARNEDGTT
jgi:hypothetical protein